MFLEQVLKPALFSIWTLHAHFSPSLLTDASPLPQAGDTVGVVRKEDGTLHFFVNGVAQGPAAWNVPPNIYAVVDLYGQAAQATIADDTGNERLVELGDVGSGIPTFAC